MDVVVSAAGTLEVHVLARGKSLKTGTQTSHANINKHPACLFRKLGHGFVGHHQMTLAVHDRSVKEGKVWLAEHLALVELTTRVDEAVIRRHNNTRARGVGAHAARQRDKFLHGVRAGIENVILRSCLLARGIDLVVVEINEPGVFEQRLALGSRHVEICARAQGASRGLNVGKHGLALRSRRSGHAVSQHKRAIRCKLKRLMRQQRRHTHLGNGGKDRLHARDLDVAAALALEQRRNVAANLIAQRVAHDNDRRFGRAHKGRQHMPVELILTRGAIDVAAIGPLPLRSGRPAGIGIGQEPVAVEILRPVRHGTGRLLEHIALDGARPQIRGAHMAIGGIHGIPIGRVGIPHLLGLRQMEPARVCLPKRAHIGHGDKQVKVTLDTAVPA